MALVVNPPPNAEDERDTSSIPGRSLGGGNGNLTPESCLKIL